MPYKKLHRRRQSPPRSSQIRPDPLLLFLTLSLTVFGIFMVYNVSAPTSLTLHQDQFYLFKLQLLWALAGVIIASIAYFIPLSAWKHLARPLFITNLILLGLVLIPGIGQQHHGGRRWLTLGALNFQPSEILKITLILYLTTILESGPQLKKFLTPLVLALGLVVLEPDLSTTAILGLAALSIYWTAGAPLSQTISLITATLIGGGLLTWLAPYRISRLLTFFDPTRDPLGASYHVRQILIALGSGSWFGVGLGQSRQKYAYLPAAPTDSIYAIIAEEIGFIGALFVATTLAILVLKCYRISSRAPDAFSQLLVSGLTSWIAIQILINLAAVVVIIPVTGVPLPLISYGGSSLLVSLVSLAIILRISSYKKP